MIKKLIIVLLIISVSISYSQNDKLNDIITKVSARMGTDKFAKLPSWKIVGQYLVPGSTMDFKFYFKQTEKLRLEISSGTNQIIIILNENDGYVLMNGVRVGLQERHRKLIQSIRSAVKNPLVDFVDNGYDLSLKGKGNFKGRDVFKIVVEKKSENYIGTFMVDANEYLPIGMTYTISQGGGVALDGSSLYLDYREISGIMVSFQINTEAAGMKSEFILNEMSTNLELNDNLFN